MPTAGLRPFHIAIIMDGNGRWANARGLPRIAGHRAGAQAVRRAVETAGSLGVTTLTLYAFSADNWLRPPSEVRALMGLLRDFLRRETRRCVDNGVRLTVIGRRDRLAPEVLRAIEWAEHSTASVSKLHLRLAIDYSAREAITRAACSAGGRQLDQAEFTALLNRTIHSDPPAPDVDLLVRTSGEKRLSDFLLWECAYAELVFIERLWPDFAAEDLRAAVEEFRRRDRRFGRVSEEAGSSRRSCAS
jgi:undecaprenyl diphosphate synthase